MDRTEFHGYAQGYRSAMKGKRAARNMFARLRRLRHYLEQYVPLHEDDRRLKKALLLEIDRAMRDARMGVRHRLQDDGWGATQ